IVRIFSKCTQTIPNNGHCQPDELGERLPTINHKHAIIAISCEKKCRGPDFVQGCSCFPARVVAGCGYQTKVQVGHNVGKNNEPCAPKPLLTSRRNDEEHMKTAARICLALLVLKGSLPGTRGEDFRTDINPALLYGRAFLLAPDLSKADS